MDENRGLILPKKNKDGVYVVSYSQLSSWKKNKRDYMRSYFFGEKFLGNEYTSFGNKVGGALELDDYSGFDEKEQTILKTIPRYDEFEREVKLHFPDHNFYVVGYIDTSDKPPKRIADYKTGDDSKCEVYESDSYNQLNIYAAAIEQETGELPEDVCVYLIDRTGNAFKGEELKVGDKFTTIPKTFTLEDIPALKEDILETVAEISEYYKAYLNLTENVKK